MKNYEREPWLIPDNPTKLDYDTATGNGPEAIEAMCSSDEYQYDYAKGSCPCSKDQIIEMVKAGGQFEEEYKVSNYRRSIEIRAEQLLEEMSKLKVKDLEYLQIEYPKVFETIIQLRRVVDI